jgi:hypothetical protein
MLVITVDNWIKFLQKAAGKTDMLDYMARKGLPIPEKATRPELWFRIMEYGFATSSLLLCVIIKTHTYY